MFEPLKIGIYILLFIPGFIFVQTREHHLLREKIPQFEKTLNIILWSTILWVISISFPYIPFANDAREIIFNSIYKLFVENKLNELPINLFEIRQSVLVFFLSVCFWTFILANIFGILRKWKLYNGIIKWITGRDWYPSVAFRFFHENMNKAVEIKTGENRYIGILYSAPDTIDDKYVIIIKPYLIQPGKQKKLEELSIVDYIIIKLDDIDEIKAYNENILKIEK